MERKEVINTLLAAKSAHMQWRARAQALVAGIQLDKDHVPVMCTDCKFGKWYYGEGQKLSKFPAFKALEDPHRQLHLVYMEIFNHLFGADQRSGWAKLFGSKKAHRKREMAAAEELLPRLVGISQTLLEAVDLLASEINSASEEELKAL
jgi:hypothetical protein